MTQPDPGRQAALFLQLILGLQQSAMMALGKLMNPMTRKLDRNLDVARDTIDTLAALEERTKDNLEPDEARVLKQVLTDLRMNYMDEAGKADAAKTEEVKEVTEEAKEATEEAKEATEEKTEEKAEEKTEEKTTG